MTERQSVEIDYCPKCRGVWLDRGELDKIIERSAAVPAATSAPTPPPNVPPGYGGYPQGHSEHHGHHDKHGQYGHHRQKSWLREIFD